MKRQERVRQHLDANSNQCHDYAHVNVYIYIYICTCMCIYVYIYTHVRMGAVVGKVNISLRVPNCCGVGQKHAQVGMHERSCHAPFKTQHPNKSLILEPFNTQAVFKFVWVCLRSRTVRLPRL